MKLLAQIAILVTATNAAANAATEGSVFSILQKNEIFIHHSSTTMDRTEKLKIRNIRCVRNDKTTNTVCTLTDAARPMENRTLERNDAADMYDAIILSGAKAVHLFGETQTELSLLECEKNISNSNGRIETECLVLKPIFDHF